MSDVQQLNRELADKLCAEAKLNPQEYPLGKLVGIANGKVVLVSEDLSEIMRELRQTESDPRKLFIVEPGRDYTKVYEIWEIS